MSITNRLNETQDEDNLEPLPDVDTYLSKVLFRGRSLAAQGDWPQAEAIYKEAVTDLEHSLGNDHIDLQVLYVELADLLADHEKPREAEAFHMLALKAVERTKGHDHPNTFYRLDAIADFYIAQGRHDEAFQIIQRAAQVIDKRSHLMCEPMLLAALCELKIAAGRYDEAEQCALKELEQWMQVVGTRHPYIARTLSKIGSLCARRGGYDVAAQRFLHAAKLNREWHGDGHEETTSFLQCIQDLLAIPNACSDAETLTVITENWLAKEAAAARVSQNTSMSSQVDECLLTPAAMFGRQVGYNLLGDAKNRAGLVQFLTKRYATLLDTADGRNVVRNRMGELISQMAYCWAEQSWENIHADNAWLDDVRQRRDFKRGVSNMVYLLATQEANKWLDSMAVRESALNPSAC